MSKFVSFLWWLMFIYLSLLFWPLAAVLLYIRVKNDYQAQYSFAKPVKIFGIILLVGFIGFVINQETDVTSILAAIHMFLIPGAIFSFWGRRLLKQSHAYREYRSLILKHHIYSIDRIATATKKEKARVREDIKAMIKKKLLLYAYLDEGAQNIVMPHLQHQKDDLKQQGELNESSAARSKVIFCSSCGANNIVNTNTQCEYCGTPL